MEPTKNLKAFQAKQALPRKTRGGGHGPNLATAVQMRLIPTPTSSDDKRGDRLAHCLANPKAGMDLSTFARNSSPIGGQLNPDWVEWLMGWPIGWTALEPLAMDKSHKWPRSPSTSSAEICVH